jgi:4-diphosphocytidyl-2-C-methyl-D-erythritol kinase
MILFAPAKINIGLKVLNKRPDGYHNLDSIFYPIPLFDIMEFSKSDTFQLISSGLTVDADPNDNLVYKAYDLINKRYKIGGLKIHLHKIIPMGAGLGGGSSDASTTLLAINKLFDLRITKDELAGFAKQLGADCPFFIYNKVVIARGIGTEFENLDLDLSNYHIVLIKPDIHISTAEAYAGVKLEGAEAKLDLSILNSQNQWRGQYINSFENHLFQKYPLLSELKESLYKHGAAYASMSGSGSTIFGLFENKPKVIDAWKKHFVWVHKL